MRRLLIAVLVLLLLAQLGTAAIHTPGGGKGCSPRLSKSIPKVNSELTFEVIMFGEFVDSNGNGIPERWEIITRVPTKLASWTIIESSKVVNGSRTKVISYVGELLVPRRGFPKKAEANVTFIIFLEEGIYGGFKLNEGDAKVIIEIRNWPWSTDNSKFFVAFSVYSEVENATCKVQGRKVKAELSRAYVEVDFSDPAFVDGEEVRPVISTYEGIIYASYPKFEVLRHDPAVLFFEKVELTQFVQVEKYGFGATFLVATIAVIVFLFALKTFRPPKEISEIAV